MREINTVLIELGIYDKLHADLKKAESLYERKYDLSKEYEESIIKLVRKTIKDYVLRLDTYDLNAWNGVDFGEYNIKNKSLRNLVIEMAPLAHNLIKFEEELRSAISKAHKESGE